MRRSEICIMYFKNEEKEDLLCWCLFRFNTGLDVGCGILKKRIKAAARRITDTQYYSERNLCL